MSDGATRPCPWCGTSDDLETDSIPIGERKRTWWVVCHRCGATGPTAKSKKGARKAWDGRAEQ